MTTLPGARADAYPHAADLALIPFATGSDRSAVHFVLTPDLTRHDGALYGGTGAAAAVMLMEAATQRDAVWVATQFVAQARIGERIDLVAHTLAAGKRIAQVHVVAQVDDRIIFTALGATAHPRPHGLTGQYDDMPLVSPPEAQCAAPSGPGAVGVGRSAASTATSSSARQPSKCRSPRAMALWARLTGPGRAMTAAGVAFVADMVPGAIARAAGKLGGGFSLDNALRFADDPGDRMGTPSPARRCRVARLRARFVHGMVAQRRAARDRKPDREHDARVRRGGRSADRRMAPHDCACRGRRRRA